MKGPRPGQASLERDYAVLRHQAGAVRISRDVISVTGPEAGAYLQGQLSQDVDALGARQSAPSLLLSPQGRIDALLRLTRIDDERFILDLDAGFGASVIDRLGRFRLRTRVGFSLQPWRCISLRGPDVSALRQALGEVFDRNESEGLIALADWPGSPGLDVLAVSPEAPAGVEECCFEAWEVIRVEAGVPQLGVDLDERTIPAEAGLVQDAVSLTKGCFVGQELVARLDARGSKVARRLRGIICAERAEAPSRGAEIRRPGDPKPRGAVTSVARSPGLGRAVALAFVHRDVEVGAEVDIVSEDGLTTGRVEELPLVT